MTHVVDLREVYSKLVCVCVCVCVYACVCVNERVCMCVCVKCFIFSCIPYVSILIYLNRLSCMRHLHLREAYFKLGMPVPAASAEL
jgi:hypothetical protein